MASETTITDELLNCPFCGGAATLESACLVRDTYWWATCHNDKCPVRCLGFQGLKKSDAITAWNTRSPQGRGENAAEAMREAAARVAEEHATQCLSDEMEDKLALGEDYDGNSYGTGSNMGAHDAGREIAAAIRALPLPAPVESRTKDEIGWVIEHGSRPDYWTGRGPDTWSPKHDEAVRFARFEDAELVRCWLVKPGGPYCKSVEHMWCAPPPAGKG